ncbi:MAG TPA: hypothetical protein PLE93_07255, partial [Solirubrobacterales bacterium]|nr:hypothetical protein [Solirubrobacterales bacterium]
MAEKVETLRLAVVQPQVDGNAPASERVPEAVRYIAEAGEAGAQIVLFPEGYPGPLRIDEAYDAARPIAEACREARVAAC